MSFFLVSNYDFIIYIDFTSITASNTPIMMSQIRSHIEYLIQAYNILLLTLYSKLMKNLASVAVFNTI